MPDSEQPEKTIDVFISYSRRDKAIAESVHQKVTQRGLSSFYDTRSIGFGDAWRDELYDAIMVSRTMIVLISRNTLDSTEVKREINKALNYGVQICPVLIGEVDRRSKLCRLVDEYHWLESKGTPTDQELDLLVDCVAAFVGVDRTVPQIALVAPKGGETFRPGDTIRLAWVISAAAETSIRQIGMELLHHGLPVYAFPGKDSPWAGSVRECDWTVPSSLPAGKYTLRLHAINNVGHVGACESDSPLVIEADGRARPPVEETPRPAAQGEEPRTAEPQTAVVAEPPRAPAPVAAALRVREPAPRAKWTREGIGLVRVELIGADEHGLTVELVSPNGPPRPLVTLSELELRGKISSAGDGRFATIPVTIPAAQPFGACQLRVSLTMAAGKTISPVEVPIEVIASTVSSRVSEFEQEESVGLGLSFAAMCALLSAGVLLLKQCNPVVRNVDWKQLDVAQLVWQLAEAAGAVLWQNILVVPLTAVIGGVLIVSGSLMWKENERRWLGGLLMGIGWGAGVGLGLSILNAQGPRAPMRAYLPYTWANPSVSDRNDVSPTRTQPRMGLDKNDPNPGPRSIRFLENLEKEPKQESEPASQPEPATTEETSTLAETKVKVAPSESEQQKNIRKAIDDAFDKALRDAEAAKDAQYAAESKVWHKAPVKLNLSYLFWCALIGAVIGVVSPLLDEKPGQ